MYYLLSSVYRTKVGNNCQSRTCIRWHRAEGEFSFLFKALSSLKPTCFGEKVNVTGLPKSTTLAFVSRVPMSSLETAEFDCLIA